MKMKFFVQVVFKISTSKVAECNSLFDMFVWSRNLSTMDRQHLISIDSVCIFKSHISGNTGCNNEMYRKIIPFIFCTINYLQYVPEVLMCSIGIKFRGMLKNGNNPLFWYLRKQITIYFISNASLYSLSHNFYISKSFKVTFINVFCFIVKDWLEQYCCSFESKKFLLNIRNVFSHATSALREKCTSQKAWNFFMYKLFLQQITTNY